MNNRDYANKLLQSKVRSFLLERQDIIFTEFSDGEIVTYASKDVSNIKMIKAKRFVRKEENIEGY